MRTLAAHQTYFFPYIGYFTVLNRADIMVHVDSFQYVKQSWMNRNRIIGESGEVIYINVPIKKCSRETPTNEALVSYESAWDQVILNHLGYYRKRAPYFKEVKEMLEELFSVKHETIADLSMASCDCVLNRLGITKEIHKVSDLDIPPVGSIDADEWGLTISLLFDDVDTYVNAPGGKEFYDTSKYKAKGIDIQFLQNRLKPYDQKRDDFIPGLSIIDVMMFNSPEEIREMLLDYDVI